MSDLEFFDFSYSAWRLKYQEIRSKVLAKRDGLCAMRTLQRRRLFSEGYDYVGLLVFTNDFNDYQLPQSLVWAWDLDLGICRPAFDECDDEECQHKNNFLDRSLAERKEYIFDWMFATDYTIAACVVDEWMSKADSMNRYLVVPAAPRVVDSDWEWDVMVWWQSEDSGFFQNMADDDHWDDANDRFPREEYRRRLIKFYDESKAYKLINDIYEWEKYATASLTKGGDLVHEHDFIKNIKVYSCKSEKRSFNNLVLIKSDTFNYITSIDHFEYGRIVCDDECWMQVYLQPKDGYSKFYYMYPTFTLDKFGNVVCDQIVGSEMFRDLLGSLKSLRMDAMIHLQSSKKRLLEKGRFSPDIEIKPEEEVELQLDSKWWNDQYARLLCLGFPYEVVHTDGVQTLSRIDVMSSKCYAADAAARCKYYVLYLDEITRYQAPELKQRLIAVQKFRTTQVPGRLSPA